MGSNISKIFKYLANTLMNIENASFKIANYTLIHSRWDTRIFQGTMHVYTKGQFRMKTGEPRGRMHRTPDRQ